MKNIRRILSIVCIAAMLFGMVGVNTSTVSAAESATMWIVGDSTVCEFDDNYYYPRYGYGTQIGNYLDGSYTIQNIALSGRSSLSFLTEKNYTQLTTEIKAGDVLVIGFGHNDQKAEEARYTNPNGDYTTPGSFAYVLYENYVKIAKEAGAEVILCTPIVRRTTAATFSPSQLHVTSDAVADGVTYPGGDYAQAIRNLGTAVNVPVVDLTELTKELYLSLGAAETLYLHSWTGMKEASVDNTHLNIYGAKKVAYLFANAAKNTDTVLASHIVSGTEPTKDADLVSNPNYTEPTYDSNLAQSEIWEDYGLFKGTVFGNIGGQSKINTTNFFLGKDDSGNMRIAAFNGNGKVASSADGFAMYYYKIPVTSTFSFSATATLNNFDSTENNSNQKAFGLMARDDMYIDLNDSAILSDYVVAGTLGDGTNCFYRKSAALAKGGALSTGALSTGQSYDLSIVSNSDGYACKFGTETTQTGGFDFMLTSVDPEYVYVGMFVSRKADVSFSNIKLVVDGEVIVGDGATTPGDTPEDPKPENPNPVDPSVAHGLVELEDGKFHLFVNGAEDTTYSGLFQYDGYWFMLSNGVVDNSLVGMVDYDGAKFYVADGQVVKHSGLVLDGNDWYFIADGQVQNVTQLVMYDNEWFVVENGKLNASCNGVYEYNGGKFFVAEGRWDQKVSGLVQCGADWYYFADGQVVDYTGLALYDGAWFYVIDGKWASDYVGQVEYSGSIFNVANGQVY